MNQIIWEQIDPALARGDVIDPRVWDYIDRVIGVKRAIPDTRLPTIQTVATVTAEKQAAIEDDAIADVSTAALSTVTVNGVNHENEVTAALIADVVLARSSENGRAGEWVGGGYADNNDKLEWMSAYAVHDADDPEYSYVPDIDAILAASARIPTLTPSKDVIDKLLSTYSWQKKLAWDWIDQNYDRVENEKLSARKLAEAINATHDKKRKISHETARAVLKDYRWQFYGE